ncbi:MAG: CCA tRNA nucleotidyltransferase [Hyphomicrobiaceae bacterium]|nr:CCA tRNA nucleotidyltransferase [Hyphomicrobiaceae bacterium]
MPSRIDAPWLREPARASVFKALAAGGHAARAVGGAVRNSILGLPIEDVDIATPATPQQVMAAAQAAGLKALPTGIAHGTITIIAEGTPTEVTTLRHDVETHGRHATVAFTDDWSQDAARRDFTMNALYCDADGTLHDPLGGYADIVARRVRFIGDAATRIREDTLRILRFFRFNARYGEGVPDAAGMAACVAERAGLAQLSGERVQQELRRLLVARRAGEMCVLLYEHGLLGLVLGRAPRVARLTRLIAIETETGAAPDFALRLGLLAVEVPEDARHLQQRLRLSNTETLRLMHVATLPAWPCAPQAATARRWLYRGGEVRFRDHVLGAWARHGAEPGAATWREVLTLPQRWPVPRFALSGADAKAAGIAPGPAVGEALARAEEAWVESDFTLSPEALRALLAPRRA